MCVFVPIDGRMLLLSIEKFKKYKAIPKDELYEKHLLEPKENAAHDGGSER